MKRKLYQLSEIKTGYTIRGAIANYQGNQIGVIQAKEVAKGDFHDLNFIDIDNPDDYSLKNGNVLLSIKGSFKATVFHELSQPTIASSSVAIFRVDNQQILPEYLALALNSAVMQREFAKIAIGASIKALSIAELKNLSLTVPDLKTQHFMVDIDRNINHQLLSLQHKQQKLQQISSYLTDKIIKGDLSND